jgi:cyclopropane fatty-acyl-phospholipid synthase-like methyltransferase
MKAILIRLIDWVPDGIRQSPFLQKIKNFLVKKMGMHDWIYSEKYYQGTVEMPAVQSATVISNCVMAKFNPQSLIDVGCGTGALLEAFQKRGVKARGLEYSEAGLALCRQRNLEVTKFDLTTDLLTKEEHYDVAISMEVAEHLPQKVADKYVGLLAKLSDIVIFTAAFPGQGGKDHINEQPHSYWIEKFARQGFSHDISLTNAWKEEWRSSNSVANWYYENLMIFQKINS